MDARVKGFVTDRLMQNAAEPLFKTIGESPNNNGKRALKGFNKEAMLAQLIQLYN